jgi:hypothetical protein
MDVATGDVTQVTPGAHPAWLDDHTLSRMPNESGLTTGCAVDATLEPARVPDRHTRLRRLS